MTVTEMTSAGPEPAAGRLPSTEDEALASVENGEAVGLPTRGGMARSLLSVFTQPGPVAREATHVVRQAGRIIRGTDDVAPSPKDKRFADPAWSVNPLYRRVLQTYLTLSDSATRLVDDYDASGAEWRAVEEARFVTNALISLLAPTNTVLGNPAALKRAFDTGGRSLVRGLSNAIGDLRSNGGLPSQVDRRAFTVGEDLAVTPGAVVYRDDVLELIQYAPATPRVRQRPLVIVPPPIGRYYFLDLRPGRSFVEYAVSQGLTVFMISWRNPSKHEGHRDLDTYAEGILSAVDVARDITSSPDVNTLGFCAGGILMTTVLNHLAAQGDDRVHSAAYAVTMLDFDSRAGLGAFSAPRLLGMARRNSSRNGVLTARQLGAVFTWMRPDDLIFNYLVNQWLLGGDPPAFDILAWNADGTNLPARLHEQFLEIFRDNLIVTPGVLSVLGTPVDLASIQVPTFVTGATTDHLTPWEACYRTTQLLGGPSTFVLSNAGHIQSLVNPPGNPKASYQGGGRLDGDPERWRSSADQRTGSWWEAWATWLLEKSGRERTAPRVLGSKAHPALEPAPGAYVREQRPT